LRKKKNEWVYFKKLLISRAIYREKSSYNDLLIRNRFRKFNSIKTLFKHKIYINLTFIVRGKTQN